MPELTDLQLRIDSRIAALAAERDTAITKREVLQAHVPFVSPAPFTLIRLNIGSVRMWVYDDELSWSGKSGGGGFELADFKSESDYVDAIVSAIAAALAN